LITIINTGGTFNKKYNKQNGLLEIEPLGKAVRKIIANSFYDNLKFEIQGIIFKDSLEFLDSDRELLKETLVKSKNKKIVVIHGTDTMDKSINYIKECKELQEKKIVFTGAMRPFSINKIEATSNLTLAIAYLNFQDKNSGIFIAMNGIAGDYREITKDRDEGKFIWRDN
jgi:L-asparaginase